MRDIDEIVIHCSATPEGRDVRPETVRGWHLRRGWRDIGYHYVVTLDGRIHAGRPISAVGAHVKGRNMTTVGICYIGGTDAQGKPKNTLTDAQRQSIHRLCRALVCVLNTPLEITGHNEHSRKACPSFRVDEEFEETVKYCRRDF